MITTYRFRAHRHCAVLLICLVTLSVHASETPAVAPEYHERIKQTRNQVKQLMDKYTIPGISIAIAVDGKKLWSQGFGYADLENQVLATSNTRFRIGSISKPVTAAGLAKLIEQGKLDIDAPIQTYVPSFPKKRWDFSTRQLAGHLAGIRHYQGNEFLNDTHYPSVIAGLEIFKHDPLLHKPGSRYKYSSYGWNLLSAAIEGAAKKDFLSYMKQAVFKPLGMDSITAEYPHKLIQNRARFYILNQQNELENAPHVDNSYKWAGGGFISSIDDIMVFALSHLDNRFLKRKTRKLLFKSQATTDGKLTNYGLGWGSGIDKKGRKYISHSGSSVGARAMLLIYPQQLTIITFLMNSHPEKFNSFAVANQLISPYLKRPQ